MNALYQRCENEFADFMTLWEQIVCIESCSDDVQGLRALGVFLEEKLTALGCTVNRHYVKGSDSEFHLVATLDGSGHKSALLMAHMDTVYSAGTLANWPFAVKGDWVHGPGVADCKVGIVTILHAVALLDPSDYKTLTILFNCDEEISSHSSKDLVIALGKEHEYALSYEPGGFGDKIVIARKGSAKIRMQVFGKNAHSGVAPEQGRNALMEMAWQLNRLGSLGNTEKGTSVVFTKAWSGDKLNVVPDHAEAWADVRAALPEELDRVERELAEITATRLIEDCRIEATLIRQRPAFPRNEVTDSLAALARNIYGELGKELEGEAVGGVGDINYAYTTGAACLCRLAPPSGKSNHSIDEKCFIPAVIPRLYLAVRMIKELCH